MTQAATDSAAKTIVAAVRILGLFSAATPEWTVKDIARHFDMPYSTAYRYVSTLQEVGYLVKRGTQGAYRIGLPLISLGGVALTQLDVRIHGLPHLTHLSSATRLNANLAVLYQGDILHVAYANQMPVPIMNTALGRRSVAHCTSLGKTLLADLPFDEVRSLIEQHGWRSCTPASIRTFPRLEQELADIRARGYATECGERTVGRNCLAAPIRDQDGRVVAAMSVSARENQLPQESFSAVAAIVVEHVNLVSYHLGHDAESEQGAFVI